MSSIQNFLCATAIVIAGLAGCGGASTPEVPPTSASAGLPQVVSTVNPASASAQAKASPTLQAAPTTSAARLQLSASTQFRIVHFDLDPIYSGNDDAAQVTSNIDMLVKRVTALYQPGTDLAIYLSAFSNPTASENVHDTVFFPGSQLRERGGNLRFDDAEFPQGELFARTARAIKMAAPEVKVYAWMPTLNFKVDPKSAYFNASLKSYIQSDLPAEQADTRQYKRLSPFVGAAWDIVAQIYTELGWSAGKYIDGIVFHDDGVITDHEDASDTARAFLRSHDWSALVPGDQRSWDQLDATDRAIRKSRYLDQFTLYMANQTQDAANSKFGLNKTLLTARHVYSSAFSNPNAVQWLSQEPRSLLQDYDNVLIETYPYMEERNKVASVAASTSFCELSREDGCVGLATAPYFDTVFNAVQAFPNGLTKTVFVMQTVDWNLRTGVVTDLTSDLLGRQMRSLFDQGAVHFGWYPDRYFKVDAHPAIAGEFERMLHTRH